MTAPPRGAPNVRGSAFPWPSKAVVRRARRIGASCRSFASPFARAEPRIDDVRGATLTAAAFVASVALSYAMFEWIEKKFVARGHRYAYARAVKGSAAAGPER